MNYLEQNEKLGRFILPDLVRAFALFGIAVVNVALFANPMGDYNWGGGVNTHFDKWAFIGVNGLFTLKSYTLFSFMFGVGFAYQMSSAQKHAASFDTRYWRRIGGLAFFGIINIAFLFHGDILVFYALLGSLLYLFKDREPKTIIKWAIGFYALQLIFIGLSALVIWALETYDAESLATAMADFETESTAGKAIYAEGGFWAVTEQRLLEWSTMMFWGVFMQGWGVMTFFLLGLAAVKTNIIHQASHPIWKKFRLYCLPLGLIGSVYGAWLMASASSILSANLMIGMFLITLFAPLSTAGYLGLLAKWANAKDGAIKTFLARGGTSSLTAYLMQGLILSWVFNGYGLGLYAKLGAGPCIAIAAGTAIFTIIFASLWRVNFERGPLEILLRRWTYAKG